MQHNSTLLAKFCENSKYGKIQLYSNSMNNKFQGIDPEKGS